MDLSKLSLRNIEQIVRCIETLVVFEDKEKSQSIIVEQILMVFLSFVYMMNKTLFNQISNRDIVSKDFFVFMQCTRLVLPENHFIVQQNYVRSLILMVLNKLNSNSNIYIPREDHRTGSQGEFILERILNKFNLESEKDRFSSYISEDSYIYDYVDYTINNLSLLNIIK